MAEKKENALSAKSSVTSSDYLRLVGSNGVSYKQLVTDVAKYIVENYAGSSLAGSSQAPKTAIDALKTSVDSLNSKTTWTSPPNTVTSLSALEAWADGLFSTNGFFIGYSSTTVSNAVGLGNMGYYLLVFSNSANFRMIYAIANNGSTVKTDAKLNGNWAGAWS